MVACTQVNRKYEKKEKKYGHYTCLKKNARKLPHKDWGCGSVGRVLA